MDKISIILHILLTTGLLGVALASGTNSTCSVPCGNECCLETEQCSHDGLYGQRCQLKGKRIDCQDGLSYCVEPSTCCGVMSCCPSDTACCGLNSCCAKGAICCGMSTCCPQGSTCCGFSMCCSEGSRCVNGLCRVPWSSSMRWYYLVAALVPFLFVMLYLAKRRQLRIAQQRGQMHRFGSATHGRNASRLDTPLAPPTTGYDPAPIAFEPPPYSEVAQLPPDFMQNPEEKPPAYSELYNDVPAPSYNGEDNEACAGNQNDTGNQANTVESGNGNQHPVDNTNTSSPQNTN